MEFVDALRSVTDALGGTFAPEQQLAMKRLEEEKRQNALSQLYSGVQQGAIDPNVGNAAIQRLGGLPTGPNELTRERIQQTEDRNEAIRRDAAMRQALAPIIQKQQRGEMTPEQAQYATLEVMNQYGKPSDVATAIAKPQVQMVQDKEGRYVQVTKPPVGPATVRDIGVTGPPKGGAAGGQISLASDPSTLRSMAEQAWAGDTSVFQNLGRGAQSGNNIILLRKEMQNIGKEQGMSPEEIGKHIAGINAQYKSFQAQERTTGTRAGQISIAANEATKMVPIVIQNMEAVAPTGFVPANKAINAYNKHTGDPKIQAYGASINAFVNSYSRAINPTGSATISDKEHARELLDSADSPEQVRAVLNTLRQEMQAALSAPPESRQQMMEEVTKPRKSKSTGGWSARVVQ